MVSSARPWEGRDCAHPSSVAQSVVAPVEGETMIPPNSGDGSTGGTASSAEADSLSKQSSAPPLDKAPRKERKYLHDAGTAPAPADIQRLCRIWAEVGRAILLRRQPAGEEDKHDR
jgi:hypothetical protein